ncbi:MAG: hypothetical protein AB1696_18640 [Planctomycetota bacterium]
MMDSPLQKPDRDPDVTDRMIAKSRQIHQRDKTRQWIGLIIIVVLIVLAACAVHYFLRGGSVTVTE